MDMFVNLAEAKLNLNFTPKELSWLQTLFLVLFDNIYKYDSITVPCEEICLQILNMVMSANENCIPTNHVVLTVKDLSNFSNNVSFVGSIGNTTSEMAKSSENNIGYLPLDKRNVILIGYLTAFPKSRNSLIPRAGLLYLEDKKNTMICQVCKPERLLQDKLVLVPKWNFIPCPKFPVLVFEGNTPAAASGSEFGYIEVIEDCVCIGEKCQKTPCHIPKSLSVGDYAEMESKLEKLNLRGRLIALSPIHRAMQNNPKEKPFFLAQLECDQTQYSTVVIFQGERFPHWHNFLSIGETFVMSNLLKTTMNKGQLSERKVLAATRNSDLFKEQPSTCVELESVPACGKNGPSEEKTRKRREESQNNGNTEKVKRPKVDPQSCSERPTISVVTHCSKSETFCCSLPMGYQGVITAIINIEAGVYEVDNRMKLYTHYQPCTNFGCGMRVGALVSLHNVHLCKLDKEVLGFCCCTYSTIRVVKHSELASPFKALVPSMYYLYRLSQRLSLLQFIRFLELTDLLIKKFRPPLSRSHIFCRKKVLKSSNLPQPTILSHVVNLDSLSSTSSRDIYQEFFGNPHSCSVSRPARKQTLPNPLTLLDILNAIDRWGTQETGEGTAAEKDEIKKLYGWHHQEITKEEISKDMVLMGWLTSCSETGQLLLCDQTAKIPCVIAETEIPKTIHKCTNCCLQERNTTGPVIVAPSEIKQNHCPMAKTHLCGAILKVESFKIVIESFGREQSSSNTGTSDEKVLAKSYLVFSLRHSHVLGTVPGIKTLGISTNQRKATVEKRTEDLVEGTAERCFVFLVKSKEIKSLDLKEVIPSLTSCVHGYLLGEVEKEDQDDPDSVSLEAFKKSVIIRFEKDCSALAFLHPGCLYYVTDRCRVDKTSRIQKALNLKEMCPVIEMNSSLSFEQIDRRLLSQNVYEEWSRLSERCLQISSVRESLSKKNQTKKENSSGFKHQEPQLLSFRGVIVNRDNVVSNQSDESCPFPTIPSGQMFLPHYGFISRSRALALSLGFCFLGTRQLVLTVRDIETADTVKVYIDLCTHHYPWGLVPGAVVTFLQVSNHTSKRGNIYFSFKACSNIIVESLSFGSSISDKTVPCLPRPPDSSATQFCNLIDFSDRHRNDEVISTVAYVSCRITAVQKVVLTSKCSKCAKLVNNCYCSFAGAKQTWIFGAQARCLVEDGTGEAMLYVENDQVKELLLTNDTSWNEIKHLSQKQGEVSYQRWAFWKNSAAGGGTRADTILSSIASSPQVFRRVKVLCRQFRMSYLDNVGKDQEHETRTITVDRNEHSTYIFGKVTLNVLDVKEVDSKEEASRLIKLITKNTTPQ